MSPFPFSKRTDWSLENNPLSMAIDRLRKDDASILDLTESNPTLCGFNVPSSWMRELSSVENLKYTPETKGLPKARSAIVEYYQHRGLTVDPEKLVLTSSTSEGYSFILKLLTNPGDHVLIPRPSYPLFQFLLELHDVSFDYYPLVYDGIWKIDQEAFTKLITPKTRAVIVVNPNNPTGSFLSPQDAVFLNEQCYARQLAIISDEVFLDYAHGAPGYSKSLVQNKAALTFVLSGISKVLALPQMKLSWIYLNGPSNIMETASEKLEIIADTYLSVNTPVQNAISSWLPESQGIQQQILERVRGNLELLRQSQVKVMAIEGGWYAVIQESEMPSEEEFVLDLLKEGQVLVHPGFFFDFPQEGFLVISLLPPPEIFVKAIQQIVRKLKIL